MTRNPEALTQESLIERASDVAEEANSVLERYFEDKSKLFTVDYLSIYTSDEVENQTLNAQAQSMGEHVANKNGNVYRFSAEFSESLPTNIVRIGDPYPKNPLTGGVDYVVGDYFEHVKGELSGRPGFDIDIKPIDGTAENSYSIIEMKDPASSVAIYFPKIQVTNRLMGLNK